jgi:hypothetical protein
MGPWFSILLNTGFSTTFRFSIRPAKSIGPWEPDQRSTGYIRSGDDVCLFSHSLGVGPFANLQKPPKMALPAFTASLRSDYNRHEKDARWKQIAIFTTLSEIGLQPPWEALEGYDIGNEKLLSQAARSLAEDYGFLTDDVVRFAAEIANQSRVEGQSKPLGRPSKARESEIVVREMCDKLDSIANQIRSLVDQSMRSRTVFTIVFE